VRKDGATAIGNVHRSLVKEFVRYACDQTDRYTDVDLFRHSCTPTDISQYAALELRAK